MLRKPGYKKFWNAVSVHGKAAAGGAAVTWDPAKNGSHMVLSNGNLQAHQDGSGSTSQGVLSTTSHSTGKFYFEVTTNVGQCGFGLANSSFTVNSTNGIGRDDANAVGTYNGGAVVINNITVGSGWGFVAPDTLAVAVDLSAKLFWVKNLTFGQPWNNNGSADPATGVGGIDISSLNAGPYFLGASMPESATTPNLILNVGGSAYTGTAPSGFGNW